MARKNYRPKSKRPPHKQKRTLTAIQKETAIALRLSGLTVKEVATSTGLGYSTIQTIMKKSEKDDALLKRARARSLDLVADLAAEQAMLALGALTEDSWKHDRVERYDDKGNLIAVQHSGSTGLQTMTGAAVAMDKMNAMRDKAEELRSGRDSSIDPDSVAALLKSVQGRVKRIQIMNIDIDTDSLQDKVMQAAQDLGLQDEVEADYTEIDED